MTTALLLVAALLIAPTFPVPRLQTFVNPTTIEFTPPVEHSTLVTSYRVEVVGSSGATVASKDIGKPAPVSNLITYEQLNTIYSAVSVGDYFVKVCAVGVSGAACTTAVGPFTVTTTPTPPPPLCVSSGGPDHPIMIVIPGYELTSRRSNSRGSEVEFDFTADLPIYKLEIDLEGDGEPGLVYMAEVGIGRDWRYTKGMRVKFTANGTWPLTVRGWNTNGEMRSTTCSPGVTVTF